MGMIRKLVNGILRPIGQETISRADASSLRKSRQRLSQLKQELAELTRKNDQRLWLYPVQTSRFLYINELIRRTADVEGDIVECGVGRGRSLVFAALSVMLHNDKRNIWGFDSFEGFPEPAAEDASERNAKKGEYAVSLEQIQTLLQEHVQNTQFIMSRITLVKGFFEETLAKAPIQNISFLNLDVDMYESYKQCLEALYPRLSPGGIVTFDEYIRESATFPGAMKAIEEFFADREVTFQRDPYFGKYFVTKT